MPFVLISLLVVQVAEASWLKEFHDSSVLTSPNAASNQKRSYYSAGGFSARVKHKSDPLMSVSLPSISAGCGGIDVFFGGVSFLNPSYLIEKATGMLKNAPYVAFSIGLKALSTQFADTIDAAQAITDQLNQLQFDECGAAKGLVSLAMGDGASGLTAEFDRLTSNTSKLVNGIEKNFTTAMTSTNENPTEAKDDAIDKKKNMDPKLKDLATGTGYVLRQFVKWNYLTKSQANAARAIMGDISYDGENDSKVVLTQGCASTLGFKDYVIEKTPLQEDPSRAGCQYESESIYERSDRYIYALYTAFTDPSKRKEIISKDIADFVTSNTLPILAYLKDVSVDKAFALGELDFLKGASAAGFAYYSLLNLSNILNMVVASIEDKAKAEQDYLIQVQQGLREYREKLNNKMTVFRDGYIANLQELNIQLSSIEKLKRTAKEKNKNNNLLILSTQP